MDIEPVSRVVVVVGETRSVVTGLTSVVRIIPDEMVPDVVLSGCFHRTRPRDTKNIIGRCPFSRCRSWRIGCCCRRCPLRLGRYYGGR